MTILIVEDDGPLREAFVSVLHEIGYAAVSAQNGQEALERIQSERPTFMFIDLLMPVMDGFLLIKVLKTDPDLSTIPFVAMTGSDASRPVGVRVMKKPFRAEDAMDVIRAHCGEPAAHPGRRARGSPAEAGLSEST